MVAGLAALGLLWGRDPGPAERAARVDWNGLDVRDVTPALIPDVYAGQPLIVSGRYGKAGRATVNAWTTASPT